MMHKVSYNVSIGGFEWKYLHVYTKV